MNREATKSLKRLVLLISAELGKNQFKLQTGKSRASFIAAGNQHSPKYSGKRKSHSFPSESSCFDPRGYTARPPDNTNQLVPQPQKKQTAKKTFS